jgi:hypothetical protein
MELGDRCIREYMDQDPKVTLQWALHSFERALQNLNDGWAERRVRRQFHQLLLAIERDAQHPVVREREDAQTAVRDDATCAVSGFSRT